MIQKNKKNSRSLIQHALKNPFKKIPEPLEYEYLCFQQKVKFKYLLQVNLIAQFAYAAYSIVDIYILYDLNPLLILSKVIYAVLMTCMTVYIYKRIKNPAIFDIFLPVSIIGAAALWFYLVNLSASPYISSYIYASLLFILLANLCIQLKFTPALICSIIITIINYIGVYFSTKATSQPIILYAIIYNPILIFSLYISWCATYNARSIFLHHKLSDCNFQALEVMAHTDLLTGLSNRRYFERLAKNKIKTTNLKEDLLFLIIFDVDHFKLINDTYGHDVGDAVLKKIAMICKGILRKNDLFARYGGEEFIVLLPNTQQQDAYKITERLRLQIEKTPLITHNNQPLYFTISAGISIINDEISSLSTAIKNADTALYQAKTSGRNKVMGQVFNMA